MKRILRGDEWFHPDGFPISIERREPQEVFEAHSHEFAREYRLRHGGES